MFSFTKFVKKIIHTVVKAVKSTVSKAAAVVRKVAVAIGFSAPAGSGGGGGSRSGGSIAPRRPSATVSPASGRPAGATLGTAQVSVDLTKLAPASPLRDAPTSGSRSGFTVGSGLKNAFGAALRVGKIMLGGCMESIALVAGTIYAVPGGLTAAAAAPEGFALTLVGTCISGAIGGSLAYGITGRDVPASGVDDLREGLEFALGR